MADTSHSLLFLSQREVIEAGVLNMEQVVPLMEKVYGLHWRGETVLPSKGVIRWGGVETEWEKGRINALPGWIGGDIRTGGIKWIDQECKLSGLNTSYSGQMGRNSALCEKCSFIHRGYP